MSYDKVISSCDDPLWKILKASEDHYAIENPDESDISSFSKLLSTYTNLIDRDYSLMNIVINYIFRRFNYVPSLGYTTGSFVLNYYKNTERDEYLFMLMMLRHKGVIKLDQDLEILYSIFRDDQPKKYNNSMYKYITLFGSVKHAKENGFQDKPYYVYTLLSGCNNPNVKINDYTEEDVELMRQYNQKLDKPCIYISYINFCQNENLRKELIRRGVNELYSIFPEYGHIKEYAVNEINARHVINLINDGLMAFSKFTEEDLSILTKYFMLFKPEYISKVGVKEMSISDFDMITPHMDNYKFLYKFLLNTIRDKPKVEIKFTVMKIHYYYLVKLHLKKKIQLVSDNKCIFKLCQKPFLYEYEYLNNFSKELQTYPFDRKKIFAEILPTKYIIVQNITQYFFGGTEGVKRAFLGVCSDIKDHMKKLIKNDFINTGISHTYDGYTLKDLEEDPEREFTVVCDSYESTCIKYEIIKPKADTTSLSLAALSYLALGYQTKIKTYISQDTTFPSISLDETSDSKQVVIYI